MSGQFRLCLRAIHPSPFYAFRSIDIHSTISHSYVTDQSCIYPHGAAGQEQNDFLNLKALRGHERRAGHPAKYPYASHFPWYFSSD